MSLPKSIIKTIRSLYLKNGDYDAESINQIASESPEIKVSLKKIATLKARKAELCKDMKSSKKPTAKKAAKKPAAKMEKEKEKEKAKEEEEVVIGSPV